MSAKASEGSVKRKKGTVPAEDINESQRAGAPRVFTNSLPLRLDDEVLKSMEENSSDLFGSADALCDAGLDINDVPTERV